MEIKKIPQINPNSVSNVLNGLIRTLIKKCKCGNEYYGQPGICPNCFERNEKLKVENENKIKLKTLMRNDLI